LHHKDVLKELEICSRTIGEKRYQQRGNAYSVQTQGNKLMKNYLAV